MKRLPFRGGDWNLAATSGVFALNLNNVRSNANTNIGARPLLGIVRSGTPTGLADSTPSKGRAILGQGARPKPKHSTGRPFQ